MFKSEFIVTGQNKLLKEYGDKVQFTISQALRPATRRAYLSQFKLYVAFCWYIGVKDLQDLYALLAFMQYLVDADLLSCTIANYMSAVKHHMAVLGLRTDMFTDLRVVKMLQGIKSVTRAAPKMKSVITLDVLRDISKACKVLDNPMLFRAIFLVAFFSFLRISNFAVSSPQAFDPTRHFTVIDFVLTEPCLMVKWEKNWQIVSQPRVVHLPVLSDKIICPIAALKALLALNQLPSKAPLFAFPNGTPVTFNQLRAALSKVVSVIGLPSQYFTFHTFRRSGASLAFNSDIPISLIRSHGGWKSDVVWKYLIPDARSSKTIVSKFQSIVSNNT